MPTKDDSTKQAALKLIGRGLITQSEGARLAGISRQLMRHWCSEIDVDRARAAYLTALWRKILRRKR